MHSDLIGAAILLGYYLLFAVLLPTILKRWLRFPTELVRKIQHIVYSLSIFVLLELFGRWWTAIAAASLLVIVAYPALMLLERLPWYRQTFVDRSRHGGELRKQLLYVQAMFALLIAVFWGLLGDSWRYVAAVAVMAWGFGDAAAALYGKAFGRRRVHHELVDPGKTYEGTGAMIVCAGVAAFLTLVFYGQQPWLSALLITAAVAPLAGLIELFSRRGTDTLTVPLAAAVVVMPLSYLFSMLGW